MDSFDSVQQPSQPLGQSLFWCRPLALNNRWGRDIRADSARAGDLLLAYAMGSQALVQELLAELSCQLCHSLYSDPHVVPICGHTFCRECIYDVLEGPGITQSQCPVCRKPVWKRELVRNHKYANLVAIAAGFRACDRGVDLAGPARYPLQPVEQAVGENLGDALDGTACQRLPGHGEDMMGCKDSQGGGQTAQADCCADRSGEAVLPSVAEKGSDVSAGSGPVPEPSDPPESRALQELQAADYTGTAPEQAVDLQPDDEAKVNRCVLPLLRLSLVGLAATGGGGGGGGIP